MTTNEMTPADIAAVTGRNNGNGFLSGDGSWFIIILFLFAFLGWGGNGRNVDNAGRIGVTDGYILASDFAQVDNKLDRIGNGICDSTFALNNTITNGFASAELSRCNGQSALMAQLNAMAMNSQKCCCDTQRQVERGFADTNYNLATQSCDTRNIINTSTRDLIDNANGNTRAILDALNAQRIEAKDAKIAEQAATINALHLSASQAAQNNYLIHQLRPSPVPAYSVPAPYTYGQACGCAAQI